MPRKKADQPRTQSTATRVLRVLKALKGRSLDGLTNGQLAEALNETPSAISLALNTLETEGFVQQLETGRYTHSVALLQIAQSHADHIARTQSRINELTARVSAGSHS